MPQRSPSAFLAAMHGQTLADTLEKIERERSLGATRVVRALVCVRGLVLWFGGDACQTRRRVGGLG